MSETAHIALLEASPRDREVQEVVLRLVEAYAFNEAAAVLQARLKELAEQKRTHLQTLFEQWSALPEEDRPDFLTYAHRRRRPALNGDNGGSK